MRVALALASEYGMYRNATTAGEADQRRVVAQTHRAHTADVFARGLILDPVEVDRQRRLTQDHGGTAQEPRGIKLVA